MSRRTPVTASTSVEEPFWARGAVVVGVDEVGKGAWAGPLVIGAVILDTSGGTADVPAGVRDSKRLSATARGRLDMEIRARARAASTGWATALECDQLGMSAAQRLACRRALEALGVHVDVAVTDGKWDFVSPHVAEVRTVIGGDDLSASIAAASIVAKVARDTAMTEVAAHYPHWSFESNKGYPCMRHRAGLAAWGPSVEHRRSWAFMDDLVWGGVRRWQRDGQISLL